MHTYMLHIFKPGAWLACMWLLKIDPVWIVGMCVCLCVCPPPRLLITSGVMWSDMDPVRLVKQVLKLLYGNCSHYR